MASETLILENTTYRRVPDTTIFAPTAKRRRRPFREDLAEFVNVEKERLIGKSLSHEFGVNLKMRFVPNY
jgi:hypothetical protein